MAFCNNCGTQLTEGAKFCPKCGTPAGAPAAQENRPQENTGYAFSTTINNSADTTALFDPKDIEQNKVMALLSYFGILVLIPLLGAKESKFARFHANQGLILCIACILYGVAYSILSAVVLAISWKLYFIVSLIGLLGIVFAILAIIGIVNTLNGKAKELPFIGKYKILK